MKSTRKIKKYLITLSLLSAFIVSLIALPSTVNAQTVRTYSTNIYVVTTPITGVGQDVLLVYWTDQMPPDIGEQSGNITSATGRAGWQGVQLIVTKPSGINETFVMGWSDPVGGGYQLYTPTEVGVHSFKAVFSGTWKNSTTYHTWYAPCESIPQNFTVQQERISGWIEAPLPEEYWNRPISGASHTWTVLAGNWLGGAAQNWPEGAVGGTTSNYAYGSAPESAHILWTHSLFDSGSLVDERFDSEAFTLNHYQDVDFPSIIVDGKIHYEAWLNAHYPGGYAVGGWGTLSLYTGEQLFLDYKATPPAFGQIYIYNSGNQHGASAYLWRTSGVTLPETVRIGRSSTERNTTTYPITTGTLWQMIDAVTGNSICYVANVSASGTAVYGKDGSILRYNAVNLGTSTSPNYYLQLWNMSKIQDMRPGDTGTNYWMWRPSGGSHTGLPQLNVVHDGSTGFTFNVSIPSILGTRNSIVNQTASIWAVREEEYVIFGTPGRNDQRGLVEGWVMAISLKRGQEGQKLWETKFTPPQGNQGWYSAVSFATAVPEYDVILFSSPTELKWFSYDMKTGQRLWESETRPQLEYYRMDYNIYEDMLLASGRAGGELTAYDLRTGEIRWNYIAEGEGTETPYGNSVMTNILVADGKIYATSSEHSATTPLWRGPNLRCINASDGTEMWKILFWGAGTTRVADGILIGWSLYDGQVYAFGRGPSATTVTGSPEISTLGNKVMLKGTVTDQTPAGRRNINNEIQFTLKGTPAISDKDMQAWMEYKFMQQGQPSTATGVKVKLDTIDPNGNYINIGETTSDMAGNYALPFSPEVPGNYQIIATFDGTASYYPSFSTTYLSVAETAPTPTTQPVTVPPPTEMYIIGAAAAMIIAIAIGFAVTILVLRKRP